jgi:2-isopropylmalate synthase
LSQITGQKVQANKAIVGKNAFAHESGIHQHGVLANRLTYEILKPEDIGVEKNNIVLGKHSGRNALNERLKALGIEVDKDELLELFKQFKSLADKKKNIYDEDLIMMAMDYDMDKKYEILDMRVVSVKDSIAHADGTMRIGDKTVKISAEGDGPVSALYAAIVTAVSLPGKLVNFNISAITPDREAVGLVKIEWKLDEKNSMYGHGSDTDVTIAAGKALIDVLNRLEIRKMHMDNQDPMRENLTER